jgi:ABC-type transporter Mla subunit MlaD
MVKVEFTVEPNLLLGSDKFSLEEGKELLVREISNNLRCYLSYQGVSGLGYLNLDYLEPGSVEEPVIQEETDNLVIPSAKGTVLAIGESISAILQSVSKVDFEKLDKSLTTTLSTVNTFSEKVNADLHNLTGSLTKTLNNIEKTSDDFSSLAKKITHDLEKINLGQQSTDLASTLRRLGAVLTQAEALTRSTKNSLPPTLENLRVMSENFRETSEMVKRYPSQVIFGQPPTEVLR